MVFCPGVDDGGCLGVRPCGVLLPEPEPLATVRGGVLRGGVPRGGVPLGGVLLTWPCLGHS